MISLIVIRDSGFLSNIILIKSRHSGLISLTYFASNFNSCFIMNFLSSSLVAATNGTSPVINPKSIIPMLQTSIAGLDWVWPNKSSGDIYFNEPAFTFSGLIPDVEPKIPKSTNLRSKSKSLTPFLPPDSIGWVQSGLRESKIFWNLRSLCMILCWWQNSIAERI